MLLKNNENSLELNSNNLEQLTKALTAKTRREIYTPELLALHLGKSVKTIHNYRKLGMTSSKIGSSIFFRDKHVEEFLDKHLIVVSSK